MNPLGSFSISMFGFSFILDGRRTTDRDVQANLIHTHLPQYLPARLASSATRPFFSNDLISYFGESCGSWQTFAGITGRRRPTMVKSFPIIYFENFSDSKGLCVSFSEEFMRSRSYLRSYIALKSCGFHQAGCAKKKIGQKF